MNENVYIWIPINYKTNGSYLMKFKINDYFDFNCIENNTMTIKK